MGWKAAVCACAAIILASTYATALVNIPWDIKHPGEWVLTKTSSSSEPRQGGEGYSFTLKSNNTEAVATETVAKMEGLEGGTASAYVRWTAPPNSAKEGDAVDATAKAGFKEEGETLAAQAENFYVEYSAPGCMWLHDASSMAVKNYQWQPTGDLKERNAQTSFKYTFPNLAKIYMCKNRLNSQSDDPYELNKMAALTNWFYFTITVKTMMLDGTTETNYTYAWLPDGRTGAAEEDCAPCQCDDPYRGKAVDTKCRFNSITGQVEKADCGGNPPSNEWKPVRTSTIIYCNDHIMTGDESWSIIQLEDMSTYILKENTEITIDTPPTKDTKIGLVLGRIWVNTKSMFTDGTLKVEMAQAVAGIKGTTFVCEETGTQSTLTVIEGSVEFTPKKDGKTEIVKAGEKITATKEGLGQKETFDVEKEKADWEAVKAKASKGSKSPCCCMPILPGAIALLAAALGSRLI